MLKAYLIQILKIVIYFVSVLNFLKINFCWTEVKLCFTYTQDVSEPFLFKLRGCNKIFSHQLLTHRIFFLLIHSSKSHYGNIVKFDKCFKVKTILKLEEIGTLRGCEGIWLDGHEPSDQYNRLTVTLSTKTPTNSYKTSSYSIHSNCIKLDHFVDSTVSQCEEK